MKCPKCGFNSFEFLESCKKCGAGFGSFKQTHGISPVILRSGSALAAAAVPDSPPEPAPAAPTGAPEEETGFSWSAPEESPGTARDMKQEEDVDFSFRDTADEVQQDGSTFSGSSIEEQPEQATTQQQDGFGEAFRDEFSFDETPLDSTTPGTSDSALNETDDFGEALLDPLSLSAEAAKEGESAVLNEFDFTALDDAAATEAPATGAGEEELFSFVAPELAEKPQEKKPAADLDDFDKEFKEIFAFEDTDEETK